MEKLCYLFDSECLFFSAVLGLSIVPSFGDRNGILVPRIEFLLCGFLLPSICCALMIFIVILIKPCHFIYLFPLLISVFLLLENMSSTSSNSVVIWVISILNSLNLGTNLWVW